MSVYRNSKPGSQELSFFQLLLLTLGGALALYCLFITLMEQA